MTDTTESFDLEAVYSAPAPKRFFYLRDLVSVVEKLLVLESDLKAKEAAVTAAEAELADTPVGYKQTIARCKVRDAEAVRDAVATELTELAGTIPAPSEILGSFYVQRIAELRIERRGLETHVVKNAALLDAEMTALKSGPWRRKDAPMPASILRLEAVDADLKAKIAKIDRQIAEFVPEMAEIDKLTRDKEEMYHWHNTPGAPTPKWVIEHERREREEILKNCVVLKVPKYVRVSGPAGGPTAGIVA